MTTMARETITIYKASVLHKKLLTENGTYKMGETTIWGKVSI